MVSLTLPKFPKLEKYLLNSILNFLSKFENLPMFNLVKNSKTSKKST